jgi:hypothetical protein
MIRERTLGSKVGTRRSGYNTALGIRDRAYELTQLCMDPYVLRPNLMIYMPSRLTLQTSNDASRMRYMTEKLSPRRFVMKSNNLRPYYAALSTNAVPAGNELLLVSTTWVMNETLSHFTSVLWSLSASQTRLPFCIKRSAQLSIQTASIITHTITVQLSSICISEGTVTLICVSR